MCETALANITSEVLKSVAPFLAELGNISASCPTSTFESTFSEFATRAEQPSLPANSEVSFVGSDGFLVSVSDVFPATGELDPSAWPQVCDADTQWTSQGTHSVQPVQSAPEVQSEDVPSTSTSPWPSTVSVSVPPAQPGTSVSEFPGPSTDAEEHLSVEPVHLESSGEDQSAAFVVNSTSAALLDYTASGSITSTRFDFPSVTEVSPTLYTKVGASSTTTTTRPSYFGPTECPPTKCLPTECVPTKCLPTKCLPTKCLPTECVPTKPTAREGEDLKTSPWQWVVNIFGVLGFVIVLLQVALSFEKGSLKYAVSEILFGTEETQRWANAQVTREGFFPWIKKAPGRAGQAIKHFLAHMFEEGAEEWMKMIPWGITGHT